MSAKSTSPATGSDNIVTCVCVQTLTSRVDFYDANPFDSRHSKLYTNFATTVASEQLNNIAENALMVKEN